jgi:hypothetical protein
MHLPKITALPVRQWDDINRRIRGIEIWEDLPTDLKIQFTDAEQDAVTHPGLYLPVLPPFKPTQQS